MTNLDLHGNDIHQIQNIHKLPALKSLYLSKSVSALSAGVLTAELHR